MGRADVDVPLCVNAAPPSASLTYKHAKDQIKEFQHLDECIEALPGSHEQMGWGSRRYNTQGDVSLVSEGCTLAAAVDLVLVVPSAMYLIICSA